MTDIINRRSLMAAGALGVLFAASPTHAEDKPLLMDPMRKSTVKPRHVLCFLGADNDQSRLMEAAEQLGFKVDHDYSQDEPDPRMQASFEVCRDRVHPGAWEPSDEDAVLKHKSVFYVVGPPMTQDNAVACSASALSIVGKMIEAGAVAVKGESAGVAHGLKRWRQLAAECGKAAQPGQEAALASAMSRICRLAFAKRPLSSDRYFESVGFHLVGLPEVYVANSLGGEWDAVHLIDNAADEMAQHGIEPTLGKRKLSVSYESSYAEDDFKFNPYGIVHINA